MPNDSDEPGSERSSVELRLECLRLAVFLMRDRISAEGSGTVMVLAEEFHRFLNL